MTAIDPEFATAMELHEHLLAVTERGIMHGEDALFVERFHLPLTISTFEGAQVLETESDVQRVLNGVREFIAIHSIDQMVRRCISADYTGRDSIQSTHVSSYLSKGNLIGSEVTIHSFALRLNGFWKISDNHCAIKQNPVLTRALSNTRPRYPIH